MRNLVFFGLLTCSLACISDPNGAMLSAALIIVAILIVAGDI